MSWSSRPVAPAAATRWPARPGHHRGRHHCVGG
jgi:hypothetical protein